MLSSGERDELEAKVMTGCRLTYAYTEAFSICIWTSELKRERDELETKVMKQDMEIRNIQQIEERKYQVSLS